ncbi:hypothetical protein M6D93_13345 [Jatrophihabitans telluris]|uniref:Uncharacterized protein n=1 Tax=Jatrophihabitans telluris TaxID=2038343 RepID=A0ABY4QW11_9ACTN|nr:hypothetical protein [Jatrophihabitans telluris]UQX87282.1 hypothetical protein M6D93_13345 [Jatrophihabitans telluris]
MRRSTARVMAASLGLAGIGAGLVWLTAPAGATVDTLSAYACLDSNSDVNVKLNDPSAAIGTYTLTLSGPNHANDANPPLPTVVNVDNTTVTVKLNGTIEAGDRVLAADVNGSTRSLNIATRCSFESPDYTIPVPTVDADAKSSGACVTTSDTAAVSATLQNWANPNTYAYRKATGLDSVPYTVSLVDPQNNVADVATIDTTGVAATGGACLTASFSRPTTFSVQFVAVDGTAAHAEVRVKPASVTVTPSRTPTPPTHTPTTPKPSTTSGGGVASTSQRIDAPSVAAPSQQAGGSATAGAAGSSRATASSSGTGAASASGTGSSAGGTGSSAGSSSAQSTPSPSAAGSSAQQIAAAARFGSDGTRVIADPPLDGRSRIFVWQTDAALIVLVDALAISALIGGVVWSAKRR